ncbi:MAG: hypothetical protein AAF490_31305, partial [Chloroflexota bacterium]
MHFMTLLLVTIFVPHSQLISAEPLTLPIGQQTLKIGIDEDGIYTLTGSDLQAAGLNLSALNPQTVTMMHRGERVATRFIGDNDSQFELNESIQFYGW